MTIALDQLGPQLAAWLLPFFRIAAVVTIAPVFGNRAVPARVKLGIAIALTVAVAPLVPDSTQAGALAHLDDLAGVLVVMREVLIGLALGFAMRLAFVVMEMTGQLVAHLMGLGFAALVDPQNGIDVPALSQFYILLATLVFLGIDGHLVVISQLAESFSAIPVGQPGLHLTSLWVLTGGAGWVFSTALQLALPAVVTLLVVNFAFGVISRAAPQLHIIVIGFPMTLLFGFFIMWLTFFTVAGELGSVFERTFAVGAELVQGF